MISQLKVEELIQWIRESVDTNLIDGAINDWVNPNKDFYAWDNLGFIIVNTLKDNLVTIHIFDERDRNKGIGSKLIEYIQSKYNYLTLHVNPNNERAKHVYTKMGFVPREDGTWEWNRINFSILTNRLLNIKTELI